MLVIELWGGMWDWLFVLVGRDNVEKLVSTKEWDLVGLGMSFENSEFSYFLGLF